MNHHAFLPGYIVEFSLFLMNKTIICFTELLFGSCWKSDSSRHNNYRNYLHNFVKNKHYLRSLLCVCWLATCRWVALANNFRSTSDWIEHSVNNRIKPYRNVCVWFLVTVTLKGYTNLIFQSDDVLICPISNPFRNVSSPQSGPVWWLTWCFMTRDGDSIGLQACKDDMCP